MITLRLDDDANLELHTHYDLMRDRLHYKAVIVRGADRIDIGEFSTIDSATYTANYWLRLERMAV